MKVNACGASHKGNVRGHNEDNLYVDGSYRSDLSMDNVLIRSKRVTEPFVYVVFDGLGGVSRGERASLIAASCLQETEKMGHGVDPNLFALAVHDVLLKETSRLEVSNMGTTAAGIIIEDDCGYVFNIGDSRVYLYRNGEIYQLSKDHSVVQSLVDGGFLDEADRNKSRHAGELTQFLGMKFDMEIEPSPSCKTVHLMEGDIILACSDGLTGELSDPQIRDIIQANEDRDADYIATRLIKQAVSGRAKDNVTVIAAKIEEL